MLDLKAWDEIPGWFNKAEGQILYNIVLDLKAPAHIIEIGCFRGKSTVAMLQACADSSGPIKKKYVSSIDNFSGSGAESGHSTDQSIQEGERLVRREIKKRKLDKWFANLWTLSSDEWFAEKTGDKFIYSMFFIDGCHSQVAKDVANAWQRLAKGGIVVCHDYDPSVKDSPVIRDIDALRLPGKHCGVHGASLWLAVKS